MTGKVYLTGQLFGEGKLIYTVAEDRDSGSCLVRAIAVTGDGLGAVVRSSPWAASSSWTAPS